MEYKEPKIAVFCGGSGTRMWPASRKAQPKQFYPLIGGRSTFQSLIDILSREFSPSDIFPVTSRAYVGYIVSQAPKIPMENIIIEPEGRDTMAAIGFSAAVLDARFDDPNVISLWSDHLIRNEKNFLKALRKASQISQKDRKIVELGVRPTYPSTQLGYIKIGKMIEQDGSLAVSEFLTHIEKPTFEKAKEFEKSWEYLWHLGHSAWSAKTLLKHFENHSPKNHKILAQIKEHVSAGRVSGEEVTNLFSKLDKISIDFGVLEKLGPEDRLVISADLGWSDVGTWDVLKDELSDSPEDNVIVGNAITVDSSNNLFFSTNKHKMMVGVGIDNLIIVDTDDALLVTTKDKAGKVKEAVNLLKEQQKDDYL